MNSSGIFDGSEFRDVERAVGIALHPQHVVNADVGDDDVEKIRPLREGRTHEQPAVASAFDRKLVGIRVLGLDQMLGASDEIIEYVLFVREISGAMPGFAELPSPTKIRHDINAAVTRATYKCPEKISESG